MEENNENKHSTMEICLGATIIGLLDCLADKDEQVRTSIYQSLMRIAEKNPNKTMQHICDYKNKHKKLGEVPTSIILRVIEFITLSKTNKLDNEIIHMIIEISVTELIKIQDNCPKIQKPALEILVSIGRQYCSQVMKSLMKHLPQGHVAHFMILHCMGTLSSANIPGIIEYIKPCFSIILPTLGMIKQDHLKQAYSFAIGRFSESITEFFTHSNNSKEEINSNDEIIMSSSNFSTEISIAYEVLLHQWLPNREPKVCSDILFALSQMFPLLPQDKLHEQIIKIVPFLLNLYRRSIDRISITQFLAAVLSTSNKLDPKILVNLSDTLISSLFDLVCVTPDYEKPQTVKGHYEVLRCFDLISEIYGSKILDMLLIQLRSNNDRERTKSLLVLTHLTNTADHQVSLKVKDFIQILKSMIQIEKQIKIKMVLLKTVVAFAQKGFIQDREFIRFIIHHCCQYNKISLDMGTVDDHKIFVEACNNSMFILSTTVGTIDDLLKHELLQYFIILDYSDACSTIAKCLATLFGKNPDFNIIENIPEINNTETIITSYTIPNPESIFIRCLALMGNFNEVQRILNILLFLKNYCTNLNKHLITLWNEKIPELITNVTNKNEKQFYDNIFNFIVLTIKDIDDTKFAERIVNKMSDQIILYIPSVQLHEYKIPNMLLERGLLLKIIGLCICYVTDAQTVDAKIDLILNTAKLEKLEKNIPNSGYETRLTDASKSLGYISRVHLTILLKKLDILINDEGTKKSTGSFFSGLNFIKDAQKDIDIYKIKVLIIESYGYIVINAPKHQLLKDIDEKMCKYLCYQLTETKDFLLKKLILTTFLNIAQEFLKLEDMNYELKTRDEISKLILKIPIDSSPENIPLFPIILKLATILIKLPNANPTDIIEHLQISCNNFFSCAQLLKSKFETNDEDDRNSFLAKYLNQSLPELNLFVRVMLEQNPSPSCLDDISNILENWLKDKNSEVRICAGHILNNTLDVYIKSMKFGCEAPSKFNQTGSMLGKIVPRCIDSNATVRQTSIDILRKILEISCIYDTLTIADSTIDWVMELQQIHDEIITDDPKEIYKLAGEIAKIISLRLSNFQYVQFSKTLLYCLNDPENSSAIGASVVLKFFIQNKGSDLFHAIPELVKESLHAVKYCENNRAKSGVLKTLIALTKHHPKFVCTEILNQQLPFEDHVIEFWQTISIDPELAGIILDNFLTILSSSCLYETSDGKDNRQKIATLLPFSIMCALRIMFSCKEITTELRIRFAEIFSMLLTTLATYTNLGPPISVAKVPSTNTKPNNNNNNNNKTVSSKFGFIPNKDAVKMSPCQIVLDAFKSFLILLEMEQVSLALSASVNLSSSQDLEHFIDILTPLAAGLVNQLNVNSSSMKNIITCLNKYISSPYDAQRIAAIGLYSQIVPLKPCGEISSVIVLHLLSSLCDPNPLVRGLCIKGLAFVGNLTEHDIKKYSESSMSSLLKGIDDYNSSCIIDVPLESMRGLSRMLKTIPCDKLDMFQVSLSIRIRPYFENTSTDIREAAIVLFGDLCQTKLNKNEIDDNSNNETTSDAFKEQLNANLCSLLLHLTENEPRIIRACKLTLKNMCAILNAPGINTMAQSHLNEYRQLNYENFIVEFVKKISEDLPDSIQDFMESCLPFLKSSWPEIRGNAAITIGLLSNYNTITNQPLDGICFKISALLRDENSFVKMKATNALGYIFGDI